jgi:hypothetical protein
MRMSAPACPALRWLRQEQTEGYSIALNDIGQLSDDAQRRQVRFGSDSNDVMRNSGRSVFIEQRKSRPPSYQFEDEKVGRRSGAAGDLPHGLYGLQCRIGCGKVWIEEAMGRLTSSAFAARASSRDLRAFFDISHCPRTSRHPTAAAACASRERRTPQAQALDREQTFRSSHPNGDQEAQSRQSAITRMYQRW